MLQNNAVKSVSRAEAEEDRITKEVKKRLNLLYGESSNPTYLVLSKATVIIISMGLFFAMKGTWMRGVGSTDNHSCIKDYGLDLFTNMHNDLRATKNNTLKKIIMIMSSELIDLIFLSMCAIW